VKVLRLVLTAALAVLLLNCAMAVAEEGHAMTPQSSLSQGPGKMRTHLRMFVPSVNEKRYAKRAVQPNELPPIPGLFFETPASLACIYNLVSVKVPGCDPNLTTTNPSGGSRAIAVVDAFDDPTAESDLATFSAQFGLTPADITVVFADGTQPGLDPTGGWEIEESLDIEWAHAMAPNAKIFLVEAADNSGSSLFNAVIVASQLVAKAGGGEVSMSFGGGEFPQETSLDQIFTMPGIVYVASSGDSPGPQYPSVSPNVISAGGTTISRNANTGRFIFENTWQDAGGGASFFEPRPDFQNVVKRIVGNTRGTPDISFDANPNTGVWVFDTNPVFGQGWFVVGGTSVAAPSLAGIINAAGSFRKSSQAENSAIYGHMANQRQFNDVFYGNCGLNIGDFADRGWDFCTGVGSDRGYDGK
jgi:kumamolisin